MLEEYPKPPEFSPQIKLVERKVDNTPHKRLTEEDLSEDQKTVLSKALEAMDDHSLVSIGGHAGTGKSSLIPFIVLNRKELGTTAFCCFTGKAANVLRRKLTAAGIDESRAGYIGTIHGLIYTPKLNKHGVVEEWKRKDAIQNDDGENITQIVVDECSMVNDRLLLDLKSYRTPILLVGDHGQLPPVDGSGIIDSPMFRLEKIHRQVADNPIIQLSQTIRETGDIPKDLQESEEIRFVSSKQLGSVLDSGFSQYGLDMGLLVRSNAKRVSFNRFATKGVPAVGQFVTCLRNQPPIFNGMRGEILELKPVHIHWYQAKILFPEDGLEVSALINKHQFNQEQTLDMETLRKKFKYPMPHPYTGLMFDFGFALTVHKAQGSAFEEVVIFPERWPSIDKGTDNYKRWLYTGVTRAAKRLHISV